MVDIIIVKDGVGSMRIGELGEWSMKDIPLSYYVLIRCTWCIRLDRWKDAQAHATDVSILEVESKNHTYCVDAR